IQWYQQGSAVWGPERAAYGALMAIERTRRLIGNIDDRESAGSLPARRHRNRLAVRRPIRRENSERVDCSVGFPQRLFSAAVSVGDEQSGFARVGSAAQKGEPLPIWGKRGSRIDIGNQTARRSAEHGHRVERRKCARSGDGSDKVNVVPIA